jgi:hypothetical protein
LTVFNQGGEKITIAAKCCASAAFKGQVISKAIFHGFPYSKEPMKVFTFFCSILKYEPN